MWDPNLAVACSVFLLIALLRLCRRKVPSLDREGARKGG